MCVLNLVRVHYFPTGNIIVSSSMNLAMVTLQYTQKVGTAVITTNNIYSGTTRGMNVVALDRDVVSHDLIMNLYVMSVH